MKKYEVSIMIPVFNEISTLSILVDRVLNYSHNNFNFKIIFIESNSTDGSREYLIELEKKIKKKILLK